MKNLKTNSSTLLWSIKGYQGNDWLAADVSWHTADDVKVCFYTVRYLVAAWGNFKGELLNAITNLFLFESIGKADWLCEVFLLN